MDEATVSVIVPHEGLEADARAAAIRVRESLDHLGIASEIILAEGSYGSALRRVVHQARGETVLIVDPDVRYDSHAVRHLIEHVRSSSVDAVFAVVEGSRDPVLLRSLVGPLLPDRRIRLKALGADAARLVIGETTLDDTLCDLEIAYLVNKYGFRVQRLAVGAPETSPGAGWWPALLAALRILRLDRNRQYRSCRRCPVCFSADVWSSAQIPGNVVRICRRCKSRFLAALPDDSATPVWREFRGHPAPLSLDEETHSAGARNKTSSRRASILRKRLGSHSRVLEVGVRDASFGTVAAREFEYVGIDTSARNARHAQSRGLEVYCGSPASFVNTGPLFDAITLFHSFEALADPHDALGRLNDLLKPGGLLVLTTFDTEGFLYLLTGRFRTARNFRSAAILYSRSALIELLEHSGFEIVSVGPDFEYRDQRLVRQLFTKEWRVLLPVVDAMLSILPDPLLLSSGSIQIIARRRSGPPQNMRPLRAVESMHAR